MLPWWVWINHNDPRVERETWSWPNLPNQLPNYKVKFLCRSRNALLYYFVFPKHKASPISHKNIQCQGRKRKKLRKEHFPNVELSTNFVTYCSVFLYSCQQFSLVLQIFSLMTQWGEKNLTKKVKATFLSFIVFRYPEVVNFRVNFNTFFWSAQLASPRSKHH